MLSTRCLGFAVAYVDWSPSLAAAVVDAACAEITKHKNKNQYTIIPDMNTVCPYAYTCSKLDTSWR